MSKKTKLAQASSGSDYSSPAQQIFGKEFGNRDILLARAPEMTREEYKILRRIQTQVLKELFGKGHSPARRLQGLIPARLGYNYFPKVKIDPVKYRASKDNAAKPVITPAPVKRTITQRKTG